MLKEKLLEDLKNSMKEKNVVRKNVVQMIRAAILQKEKDNQIELSDEEIMQIIAKEAKTRKDALPDYEKSGREDLIKEVKEETGLDVDAIKIISVQDRNMHNKPIYAYGVCKIFVLCNVTGGKFIENIETTEIKYFSLEELPNNLAEEKSNREQIEMCFRAYNNPDWKVQFD